MGEKALFNSADHATRAGWATHHRRPVARSWWHRFACRLIGHRYPPPPANPNGYSPSNTGRCARCDAHVNFYVVGQHHFGGIGDEALRKALLDEGRTDG